MKFYMLSYTLDTYRWVGATQGDSNSGRRLRQVKMNPVADKWDPVPVEWIPETANRAVPDFPNFWSGMLCVSKRAVDALDSFFVQSGEYLPLLGLNGQYIGFHCLRTLAVLDADRTKFALDQNKDRSFLSPYFVPSLRLAEVPHDCDMFKIPESFQKHFVSERFKDAYRSAWLKGLDFVPIQ